MEICYGHKVAPCKWNIQSLEAAFTTGFFADVNELFSSY